MNRPHPIPLYSTIIVFLAILFFGLTPKGYDFSNHVSRLTDGPGIRFDKFGIAYAQLDSRVSGWIAGRDCFSILLVFQTDQPDLKGSGHILTFHDGKDSSQLVIWQWLSHIIVMNDNDYAHRRKIGRVSAEIASSPPQKIFLSLTTGPNGTHLYFDGKDVSFNRALKLDFPKGAQTVLTLGNSVYGNGSWKGYIYGFALFDSELPPDSIASLYSAWAESRLFSGMEKEKPSLLYFFDEKEGNSIIDHAGYRNPLIIPARATPLRKQFLSMSLTDSASIDNLIRDVILNLTGFIPPGFFLCTLFIDLGGTLRKRAVIHTIVFCFAVSLAIEIFQAWLPSRSSQMLDLLLNTAGASMGAMLSVLILRGKSRII